MTTDTLTNFDSVHLLDEKTISPSFILALLVFFVIIIFHYYLSQTNSEKNSRTNFSKNWLASLKKIGELPSKKKKNKEISVAWDEYESPYKIDLSERNNQGE